MFQQMLDTRIRELWNLYEATGDIKHSGEKGLFRELFVRRVIESVLPHHYGVGSGIVVDKWKRQSPQLDLVIFDRRRLPPIFEENGHGIYPIDAVLRFVEVKSTLNEEGIKQFRRAVDAFDPKNANGLKMATKGYLGDGNSFYPFGVLFAYSTTLGREKIAEFKAEQTDLGTATIFVAKQSPPIANDLTLEQVVRLFLTVLLGEIESSSASRKEFSVIEWLF